MLHDLCVTVCVCSEGSALFHIRALYESQPSVSVDFLVSCISNSIGIFFVHLSYIWRGGPVNRKSLSTVLTICKVVFCYCNLNGSDVITQ